MDGWHESDRSIWRRSTGATMPTGDHLHPRREQLFVDVDRQQRQPVALNWRGVYQHDSATFKSAGIFQRVVGIRRNCKLPWWLRQRLEVGEADRIHPYGPVG